MLLLSYSITPTSVIFSAPSQSMKKSSIIFVKIRLYRLTEPSYTCTVNVFVMKMELLEEISHIPRFSGFAADVLFVGEVQPVALLNSLHHV